jgi:hypothetical protein
MIIASVEELFFGRILIQTAKNITPAGPTYKIDK